MMETGPDIRLLVTGATGFAGHHLLHYFATEMPSAILHGTSLSPTSDLKSVTLHQLDLCADEATRRLVREVQPTHVAHLAAMSSPRQSLANAWGTIENNLRAQINLLEACSTLATQPRVLVVSSADIYDPQDDPITENTSFRPTSPYAVSKIAQDMHALQFGLERGLPIVRARPFNFLGPGQAEGFVAADFAWQVARIEAGRQPPVIRVGNLAARRDFSDVRDVVRAFALLLLNGGAGLVCNIASGQAHSIQALLDTLLAMSEVSIEVQIDEARFVPLDVPLKRGDYSRLQATTGWRPQIPPEQSLRDLLQECRAALHA